MAGPADVKSLLLEVDASVELLRRNLTRGDQAVGQFESDTRARLDRMDRRFEQLGGGLRQLPGTIGRARAEIATIGNSAARVEQQVRAASAGMRSALLASTAGIAAAFSVDRIKDYADGYTRYTNQLKVAGLEGAALGRTQEQLYAIAQRYGVQLESVGTLYGRASQSAKALGASDAELIRFTNGVGAALKVQGGAASEAQGALMQLSQLLGAGTVRAEEFNSVNEGARPILQAVANGIDKYKGSVAALRADVLAGSVTSKDFFQGFLKGSAQLEAQAAKSNLTIGASLTILNNALGKYIGEADASLSATARVSQAITSVADNLDLVAPALAVIAARYAVAGIAGSQFAAGLVATATGAAATSRLLVQELVQENVVLIGGKVAIAAKAEAVAAAARTEVASIEATIVARRADQAALAQSIALIEAQRVAAAQSLAAIRTNAGLGFGTLGQGGATRQSAQLDGGRALKAELATKKALAAVNAEVAAAETALASAQARAAAATTAATVATNQATIASRAAAAASKLFAGALTLIGGSVAGGAAILVIGGLVAAYLSYSREAAAAEARNRATAQSLRDTAEAGKILNQDLAQLATTGASAAGGIAQAGAAAATSTGQMLSFAGAIGEAAEKLRQLAVARRNEQVLSFTTQSVAAEQRANEAQARINARNRPSMLAMSGGSAMAVTGGSSLTTADRRANAADARIVAENRAQQGAAYRAAQQAAQIPLASRIRESDRNGGRDVDGDLARVTRDLTIARERGLRTQVDALEAQRFELTQYKKYRASGLSAEAAGQAASGDASRFRGASSGAQGDRNARAARTAGNRATRQTAALQRQEAAAARDAAGDARAYSAAERQANNEIAAARADLSGSAQERAQIERDRIEAERQNRGEEIAEQAKQGRFGGGTVAKTRALELQRLNDERARLETEALAAREKQRGADEQLAIAQATRDTQQDVLRAQANAAGTLAERRTIELRLLDLQYQEERARLDGVIASRDTSEAEKEIARRRRAALGTLQAADRRDVEQRTAGPVEQYRDRLRRASGDVHEALDGVAADGLQQIEDSLVGIVTGTESVGSAFKRMAASIIADLARIAVQKAILSAVGTSFLGFADGGRVPGFADGGSPGGVIQGPGTGRSDSILALLAGPGGGAIRVSAGETIMNERASRSYGPMLEAMNRGRLRGFADGGRVGSVSQLRAPQLPSFGGAAVSPGGGVVTVRVQLDDDLDARIDNRAAGVAVEVVRQSAPALVDAAKTRTLADLQRPRL